MVAKVDYNKQLLVMSLSLVNAPIGSVVNIYSKCYAKNGFQQIVFRIQNQVARALRRRNGTRGRGEDLRLKVFCVTVVPKILLAMDVRTMYLVYCTKYLLYCYIRLPSRSTILLLKSETYRCVPCIHSVVKVQCATCSLAVLVTTVYRYLQTVNFTVKLFG